MDCHKLFYVIDILAYREKNLVQHSYSPVSTEEEEDERVQSFDEEI